MSIVFIETGFLVTQQGNYNLSNRFDLVLGRLPETEFSVQKCSIPGVQATTSLFTSPLNAQMNASSDDVSFNPLQISFLVDEDLANWSEVFELMRGASPFESTDEYNGYDQNPMDVRLMVYDSHDRLVKTFTFVNCYVLSLGDINYDLTNASSDAVVCDMTIVFDYPKLEYHKN